MGVSGITLVSNIDPVLTQAPNKSFDVVNRDDLIVLRADDEKRRLGGVGAHIGRGENGTVHRIGPVGLTVSKHMLRSVDGVIEGTCAPNGGRDERGLPEYLGIPQGEARRTESSHRDAAKRAVRRARLRTVACIDSGDKVGDDGLFHVHAIADIDVEAVEAVDTYRYGRLADRRLKSIKQAGDIKSIGKITVVAV